LSKIHSYRLLFRRVYSLGSVHPEQGIVWTLFM